MRLWIILTSLMLALIAIGSAPSYADPTIPKYWDNRERIQRPDLKAVERIRFLTTIDFPPFNFVDNNGKLSGFNVEVARAVCAELGVSDRCQIEAVPWVELQGVLTSRGAEAVIAGLEPSTDARETLGFTRSYLRLPARFVGLRDGASTFSTADLTGKRIGVVTGSAHAAILSTYFPGVEAVGFADQTAMLTDLRARKLDAVFGDGLSLSFWIGGSESDRCCAFVGGPYTAQQFLGEGMTIAVRKEDQILVDAFNSALQALEEKGVMSELYLRYFPNSFY